MTKIGFIGLGHMGTPMVQNCLHAGFDVRVFDIRKEAMAPLASEGASVAQSYQDIAEFADVIITMLQTGEQVTQVCMGEGGLFEFAKPGTLFIDSSSIDIKTSRELHAAASEHGFRMLDAPVSGGVLGAENASLTIMVGGDAEDLAEAQAIFDVLGKTVIHTGPAGNGQAAKICNNMILGISMIAISEAFTLAEKLGLEPSTLFEVSAHSSGQCWAMTNYAPVPGLVDASPANRDYEPGFSANMMLKDLSLSQDAADHANALTPLGHEAMELYQVFVERGMGDLDFSGIIKLFQK